MRIGIDIDDTISNTFEVLFGYAQKYTIEDLEEDIDIKSFYEMQTTYYIENLHKWENGQTKNFFRKYYETILKEVKPKIFAVETINKLKEEGNEIYLITARFDAEGFDLEEVTRKWLKDNNIKYDKLFLNAYNKDEIVKQNNVDIFIDDSCRNTKAVSEIGVKTLLMNSIINLKMEDENIKRVYSWPQIYQEIKK